ncbi:hypothetical protein K2Z83_16980, partial [Oscillochloris sp. ZM17-4]|uniref:hypothetical protein n=1 Tax=Oscillochloris sp. ZM17-4 TaxID=2866714 RepID=UPI001C73C7F2
LLFWPPWPAKLAMVAKTTSVFRAAALTLMRMGLKPSALVCEGSLRRLHAPSQAAAFADRIPRLERAGLIVQRHVVGQCYVPSEALVGT